MTVMLNPFIAPSHSQFDGKACRTVYSILSVGQISELKSVIKIDITANPRDEISYLKDMCRSLEIFDSQVRYKILTSV